MNYDKLARDAGHEANVAYRDKDRHFWQMIQRCWTALHDLDALGAVEKGEPKKWFATHR